MGASVGVRQAPQQHTGKRGAAQGRVGQAPPTPERQKRENFRVPLPYLSLMGSILPKGTEEVFCPNWQGWGLRLVTERGEEASAEKALWAQPLHLPSPPRPCP